MAKKGFTCLGYAIYCDNCGRRHQLPAADSLDQAIKDAKSKGLVIDGDAQFCNEACRAEDAGEICQHSWPRSGPDAFVCVKCGVHRDNVQS